ncbi:transmembrane anchor protein [Sansalvadorimonas sp. 2012CJ34-2]|uniref:Transmembrane anchor protein n=1 Tax=Parendozoicomonas callyspongiae TaxID=2942213 RepID=A0ABT0PAC6_9GAMM|nr:transmembrane anchor protein [Sansalvadorimonas sp. 2012CJ34-2]MCL6268344.1 transmembrane anchor protein [Sansalvadorimonas sp. 2012CJ34-2]
MYNSNIPSRNELPSSKQLVVSTFIALIVACTLLITCVLPAEYGIDPTGIGRSLGLTQMGEIKEQLAEEATQDQALQEQPTQKQVASATPETSNTASETYKVTLKPGEAAEVKLAMKKDADVDYYWSVNQGHVNFDTHADNSQVKYHGYNKGKAVTEDKGVMTAVFDGKHGWFWRNRSETTVTITLKLTGNYSELIRVL